MQDATPPGTGHNRGPSVEGGGFRAHCWQIARTELLGPRLPVEVVRVQLRRAKALGMDYKTYAGVRATTGRDLIAFLYSSNGLAVFRDGQAPAAGVSARIAASAAVPHLGVSPGIDPAKLGAQIVARSAISLPVFGAAWGAMRTDMKGWLRAQGLPANAVLMIGETDHEREIMAAAGLAGFVAGQTFFAGTDYAV